MFPRRHLSCWIGALALLGASCTGGDAVPEVSSTSTLPPPTTTTVVETRAPVVPNTVAMPTFADDAEPIPSDADVLTATLDNGLTYFVRRNTRPGDRAQLRLVVKAGSVLEAADQEGVAHYLEHMLFNGTERYPANDLVRVLESFGAEFGPDINAFTNFDETVYELELATDQPDLLATGLDVLLEWAARATIDPAEVELERGVLLEEWRLRTSGFSAVYFEEVVDRLLGGTAYEGHTTLAGPDELAVTTAETLRRFYEDWYRPELMAVVAVGDFDPDTMVAMIEERFGPLENPPGAPPRPVITTEPAADPTFVSLSHRELPNAFVELNYPLPSLPQGTVGTLRQELAVSLAFDMLVRRLDEDARSGASPFFGASHAANPFTAAQRTPGLGAFAEPEDLAASAEALLVEVRRAMIHGFLESELTRVVDDARSGVELAYQGRESTQDFEHAAALVSHFLTGSPIPDATAERDLLLRLLDEVTLAQVWDTFRASISSTRPLVIAAGPLAASGVIPGEVELAAILAAVESSTPPERPEITLQAGELMTQPEPAALVENVPGPLPDSTKLVFENGVTVVFAESDISAGEVGFAAQSLGGWSLLAPEDFAEAILIGAIAADSGVASFNAVELSRLLTGRNVGVSAFIDQTREGLGGGADVDDLEVLFQLIHLFMTDPRADQAAVASLLGQLRPIIDDPTSVPFFALQQELVGLRYGSDTRFFGLPSSSQLADLDIDRALELLRERFADASDFVFGFVGDVDVDQIIDLSARYLGTLPAFGRDESWQDVLPEAPEGIIRSVVEAGSSDLGAIAYLYSTETEPDRTIRIQVPVLEAILNQRLTAVLREALGATYSPSVVSQVVSEPRGQVEFVIQVSGDPAGLDAIDQAVMADLRALRRDGPTDQQFRAAVEQVLRNYELINNGDLLFPMLEYFLVPGYDIDVVTEREQLTRAVGKDEITTLTRLLLPEDRYIEVRLVPES